MPRKKRQSRLDRITDTLKTADLRLRLAEDLGVDQRHIALHELTEACNELRDIMKDVRSGRYHGEVE